ncbi:hypothetical protein BO70DRAFT_421622 [Aspergillus heteromorphus CBS 117.55]|uniref:Uncharacterized protein n=1 Tax=Aspergillus heteromorphus CBS 117.55 TaxID=1448321 RepID=A0A317WQY3_9EURO|nr:uncharacterized protein BO70DRAFT_421622 [Aspergillus heteromorphus CBS 117.55]PWY87682.1 hypothetical protein BO70DRAFT_421622 [Aspergillus heteromorphus CBS 117.55]
MNIIRSWWGLGSWLLLVAVAATSLFASDISNVAGEENDIGIHANRTARTILRTRASTVPPGDFPICTNPRGPSRPFCLPEDGANVTVEGTYYVTWNADFYPLNATITIELRYSDSSEGDSAFTSERTDNSYGYTHIHMRQEWLQGRHRNLLTLYIIELDPISDKRASARRGPTITLYPKPVEHRIPPPRVRFNKLALYIGLPVSFSVVVFVVAGLYFGMRESRRIDLGYVARPGYGIGKSKIQRLGRHEGERNGSDCSSALKKYSDEFDSGVSEAAHPDHYGDLERSPTLGFKRDSSKLKSWRM